MEYVSQCPTCGRERKYKTKNGFIKGINKNCKSCANSIKVGGKGYTKFCECGNLKYEKSSTYCKECHIKKVTLITYKHIVLNNMV